MGYVVGKIQYRDSSLQVQGEVDTYEHIQLIPRFNDVGFWELSLPDDCPAAKFLVLNQGSGINVYRPDGTALFSGPFLHRYDTFEGSRSHTLTLRGPSDEVWLGRELCYPEAPALTTATNAYDTRTGAAETVMKAYVSNNCGQLADPVRWYSQSNVPLPLGPVEADAGRGLQVTGKGRFQSVLSLCQSLATQAGLGFRVLPVGGQLQFQVYQPTDRTASAKFSIGLGNLRQYEYESIGPDATVVVVGGAGAGQARLFASCASSYAATVVGDAPASYWRMNALSGTTEVDVMGASNATYVGGFTLKQRGGITDTDLSVKLDGSTGYITTTAANDPSASDFSVEAWFYSLTPTQGVAQAIVQQNNGGGTGRTWLQINPTTGHIMTNAYLANLDSGIAAVAGAWTHAVVTKASTTIKLYVNGVLAATGTAVDPVGTSIIGTWMLGTAKTPPSDILNGGLDEVALYPTALTATQVATHYAVGVATTMAQTWGRVETFLDKRDASSLSLLYQAASEELVKHAQTLRMGMTPVDTGSLVYGSGYGLGDKVTVELANLGLVPTVKIQDIVREALIVKDAKKGEVVQPVVGSYGQNMGPTEFADMNGLSDRITNIERLQ